MSLQNWIEKHKISWLFLVFVSGLALGIGGALLLGGGMRQLTLMGFTYGSILVFSDIAIWGGK